MSTLATPPATASTPSASESPCHVSYTPVEEVVVHSRRHVPVSPERFDPSEPVIGLILSDLSLPLVTLHDIAARAHTTVHALMLWMTRPDISPRIDALEAAFARRARLAILAFTPQILAACHRSITEYHQIESELRGVNTVESAAISCRNRAVNNDTHKILLRLQAYLARYDAPPKTTHAPHAPNPHDTPGSGAAENPSPSPDRAPTPDTSPADSSSSPTSHIEHPTSDIPPDP